MGLVEKSIDVNVPVQVAYNQWTQFEEFPKFMQGVKEVRQIDDTTLHWTAEIGGQEREWKANISEQIPDERIAWAGEGDTPNAGVVTFHRLDDGTTRIMLQMEYDPTNFKEKAGDLLGIIGRRVDGDLKRFKEFIEARGQETGAWRGTVAQDRIR
jgi:uncharacterized membrane protein